MPSTKKTVNRIGVLTGGGDCPGLNAVIRVITKAAINKLGIEVMGIEDGFLGLIRNKIRPLTNDDVSNILFQGGTILAAMWLLVMMAGLADAPPVSRTRLRLALVAGPVVFIAIGASGVATAGAFLGYPDGFAKPLIKVIEWALLPSLALTLALILAGAPERAEK